MKSKGEETRSRILDTATDLIHRKGFGATSINDLLEATNIKKGCLYFHFPGKDALGLAVLEKMRDDFLDVLETSLAGTTPGECLDNFFATVADVHKGRGFVGGCIFGNTALEMGDTDNRLVAIIRQVFKTWLGKLKTVIAAAQNSGEVRNDIPADILACQMLAAIEGGIMLSRLEKDEKPLCDALGALRTMMRVK
ncbi:transcriptional regulator, TetR family [Geobacter metallireducens RCH3]|uniref:Transcriptional regulator, TetR family n=1 Tax=Geobacter metallireducens (strain ATCC 53774 / DSM 7210 / GS-15) TaxID=269799 RepID=Q39SB1_GEOMG|nr:TetR/AcrR family transcriptional regulator [Geobacter metallireducens]ABB32863.1 transcriptional regulator, TetR family [Geobacter metallireducens GS-15]EHP89004.1 transcriptional regulator, TetR family [Geobacter metallireducens RCH3]